MAVEKFVPSIYAKWRDEGIARVLAGKSGGTTFDQTPLTLKHDLLISFVFLWYLWAEI